MVSHFFFFFFLNKISIYSIYFCDFSLYNYIKISISFLCKRKLNHKSLIQPSNILLIELTGIHPMSPFIRKNFENERLVFIQFYKIGDPAIDQNLTATVFVVTLILHKLNACKPALDEGHRSHTKLFTLFIIGIWTLER